MGCSIMDDVTLSKEEQEELQAKLKEGAKNAQIFQNKVMYLQETVVNMMKRKAVAEEELIREKKTLKQKSEELDYMKKRLHMGAKRKERGMTPWCRPPPRSPGLDLSDACPSGPSGPWETVP